MSEPYSTYRWTVGLPDQSPILDILHEVRETSGLRMGELLEQALTTWYEQLPLAEDHEHVAVESCNHRQQRVTRT